MAHRSGFVAVVGPPNAGKSTLVNLLVGQKVSIVSNKAQTTRRRILGIATREDWQMVLVDTPGVHKPHNRLGRVLVDTAQRSVEDVDLTLVMVDASRKPCPDDREIAGMLERSGRFAEGKLQRVVLALNKMDRLKPEFVNDHYEAYTKLFPTDAVMLTSLTKEQNVDLLLNLLVDRLPEGPVLYDPEMVTDQPLRLLVAELVREKALVLTRQEVPHAVATYVETWEETGRNLTKIGVVILVERDSQRAILIGKGGEMLKKIGSQARVEMEEAVGTKVFLELFVRVREGWRESTRHLRELEIME